MEQNYLPLFRKYRPQSFEDVVGQPSLVKALSNAIELNRIANAYLFCGPRGTGKTSCARIFAKSLNCEHGPTLTPCQKCASCTDITNATGLDVIEIDAASNRGIQDAKELISQVQYAPINGKYKIFIIDEVHMLSNDAFNALLKTFEEPPKNVIFILATTEPHKVLETIVSRCQRFDLRRITIDDITKRLREISDKENIKITDDALYTIAKNVSGGLRDSLALLDQVSILGVKEEIGKELIEELLGKINFEVLLNLLKDICAKDIKLSLNDIEEIYTKGNEPRNLAENFIEFLRNVILTIDSSDIENIKKLTSFSQDDIQKVQNCSFEKNRILQILNTIIEYYKEIKVSTNPYLWMELGAISSCAPDEKTQKAQIEKNVSIKNINFEEDKKVIEQPKPLQKDIQELKPVLQPEVQETKDEQPKNNIKQDASEIWLNVLSNIASLPAKAFYTGVAKLVGVENNKIILGFLHENALAQAKTQTKMQQLENAIKAVNSSYSAEFIKIDSDSKVIEVKPKSASRTASFQKPQMSAPINNQQDNNIADENKQDETEQNKTQKKHYSPKVQEMIEQFNGRIIEE